MLVSKSNGGLSAGLRRSKEKENLGVLGKLKIVSSAKQTVEYDFPKPKSVPAGQYTSKIADILEATTKQGDPAVDVHYDFHSGDCHYRVKMRYPIDSSHFGALCDALIAAGIPEEANIKKGVGVEESVTLAYPNGATMGSIVQRSPVTTSAANADEADEDEDDDLLLDDDDLEED